MTEEVVPPGTDDPSEKPAEPVGEQHVARDDTADEADSGPAPQETAQTPPLEGTESAAQIEAEKNAPETAPSEADVDPGDELQQGAINEPTHADTEEDEDPSNALAQGDPLSPKTGERTPVVSVTDGTECNRVISSDANSSTGQPEIPTKEETDSVLPSPDAKEPVQDPGIIDVDPGIGEHGVIDVDTLEDVDEEEATDGEVQDAQHDSPANVTTEPDPRPAAADLKPSPGSPIDLTSSPAPAVTEQPALETTMDDTPLEGSTGSVQPAEPQREVVDLDKASDERLATDENDEKLLFVPAQDPILAPAKDQDAPMQTDVPLPHDEEEAATASLPTQGDDGRNEGAMDADLAESDEPSEDDENRKGNDNKESEKKIENSERAREELATDEGGAEGSHSTADVPVKRVAAETVAGEDKSGVADGDEASSSDNALQEAIPTERDPADRIKSVSPEQTPFEDTLKESQALEKTVPEKDQELVEYPESSDKDAMDVEGSGKLGDGTETEKDGTIAEGALAPSAEETDVVMKDDAESAPEFQNQPEDIVPEASGKVESGVSLEKEVGPPVVSTVDAKKMDVDGQAQKQPATLTDSPSKEQVSTENAVLKAKETPPLTKTPASLDDTNQSEKNDVGMKLQPLPQPSQAAPVVQSTPVNETPEKNGTTVQEVQAQQQSVQSAPRASVSAGAAGESLKVVKEKVEEIAEKKEQSHASGHLAPMFGIQIAKPGKGGPVSFSSPPRFPRYSLSPHAPPFVPASLRNESMSEVQSSKAKPVVVSGAVSESKPEIGKVAPGKSVAESLAETTEKPEPSTPAETVKIPQKRVAFAPTPVEVSKRREEAAAAVARQLPEKLAPPTAGKQRVVQVRTDEGLRREVSEVHMSVRHGTGKVMRREGLSTVRLTVRQGGGAKLEFFKGGGPFMALWASFSSSKDNLRIRKVMNKPYIMTVAKLGPPRTEATGTEEVATKYFLHLEKDTFEALFTPAVANLQRQAKGPIDVEKPRPPNKTDALSEAKIPEQKEALTSPQQPTGVKRAAERGAPAQASKKSKLLADKKKLLDKMEALRKKKVQKGVPGASKNVAQEVAGEVKLKPPQTTETKPERQQRLMKSNPEHVTSALLTTGSTSRLLNNLKGQKRGDLKSGSVPVTQQTLAEVGKSSIGKRTSENGTEDPPSARKGQVSNPSLRSIMPGVAKGSTLLTPKSARTLALRTRPLNDPSKSDHSNVEVQPATDRAPEPQPGRESKVISELTAELERSKEHNEKLRREVAAEKTELHNERGRKSSLEQQYSKSWTAVTQSIEKLKHGLKRFNRESIDRARPSLVQCDVTSVNDFFARLHTFRPSTWAAFEDREIGALECALRGWYNNKPDSIRSSEGSEIVLGSEFEDLETREEETKRVHSLLREGHRLLSGWIGQSCPESFRSIAGTEIGLTKERLAAQVAALKEGGLGTKLADISYLSDVRLQTEDICEKLVAYNWSLEDGFLRCTWCNKQVDVEDESSFDPQSAHYEFCPFRATASNAAIEQNAQALGIQTDGDTVMRDVVSQS